MVDFLTRGIQGTEQLATQVSLTGVQSVVGSGFDTNLGFPYTQRGHHPPNLDTRKVV